MVDERTEQLITRRLDGELADGESLELDKALIRAPEVREALEQSQRIDSLASETLMALLGGPDPDALKSAARVQVKARGDWRRFVHYAVGAAAAVLLVMAGAPWLLVSRNASTPFVVPARPRETATVVSAPPAIFVSDENPQEAAIARLIPGARERRERINQDVIGVMDPETQSVYLLELQTARDTVRRVRAHY
jgi:hypothetical protein